MDGGQKAAIALALAWYLEEEAQAYAQASVRAAPPQWRMWGRRRLARYGPGMFPNSRWASLASWRDPRYSMYG